MAGLVAGRAHAQDLVSKEQKVRIGVLCDMAPGYAAEQATGLVIAARLAAADAGGRAGTLIVEVVSADHGNEPDIGAAIAQRWLDNEQVDAIVDMPATTVALTVGDTVRDRNKVLLGVGLGMADLAGARCSSNTVDWTTDNWELAHTLGHAVLQHGGNNWFFITGDQAFGNDLQAQLEDAVRTGGGTVAGMVRHPPGAKDFTSFLLQAHTSGANVLALACSGADAANVIKQAADYGLNQNMMMVGPTANVNVIAAAGLKRTAGMLTASPYYWDHDDASRAFATRFSTAHPARVMPNETQAGVYAAVTHYLKAVASVGSADDGRVVVDAMKRAPTTDPLFASGKIRSDGRKLNEILLFETKTPAESTADWDFLREVEAIPAEQAFRPLDKGTCKLTLL